MSPIGGGGGGGGGASPFQAHPCSSVAGMDRTITTMPMPCTPWLHSRVSSLESRGTRHFLTRGAPCWQWHSKRELGGRSNPQGIVPLVTACSHLLTVTVRPQRPTHRYISTSAPEMASRPLVQALVTALEATSERLFSLLPHQVPPSRPGPILWESMVGFHGMPHNPSARLCVRCL